MTMSTAERPPATVPDHAARAGGVEMRVAIALGRVEGRRLVRHPAVVAFGVLTAFALWFFEGEVTDLNTAYGTALAFYPMCAGVLLATNLATLRARRAATEETFGSTATSPATRTIGHVVSGIYPFLAGVALVALWIVAQRLTGAIGGPDPFEMLFGPILILGAGAVGVMLARLIPSSLAAIPGIVAIGLITGWLNSFEDTSWRLEWLAPFPGANDGLPAVAWPRPTGMHAAYLAALAVTLCGIAVLRHDRRRRVVVAVLLAASMAGATGWAHARPPSQGTISSAVAWLTTPPEVCRERTTVRLCVYPGYEQLLDRWADAVDPVLAATPPRALPGRLDVIQLIPQEMLTTLSPAVRERLPERVLTGAWRRDGAIHPDLGWAQGSLTAVALSTRAASWVVGLPVEPALRPATAADFEGLEPITDRSPGVGIGDPIPTACSAAGQARAVVALWLTGLAHDGAATFAPAFSADPDDGMSTDGGSLDITPPPWISELPTAVVWSISDLRYAMELLERPDATEALRASWHSYTTPTTTSEQLARDLSLTPHAPSSAPVSLPPCR